MSGLASVLPLVMALATGPATPSGPNEDPMVQAFQTLCLTQPGQLEENRRAAEADGWRPVLEGEDEKFDRIIAFARTMREAAQAQNFHVEWKAFSKTIEGRRIYLGLTDKRFEGKSERECVVSDLEAEAGIDEGRLTAMLGKAPKRRTEQFGMRVAVWDTLSSLPLVAYIRSQFISADSPMAQMIAGGSTLQMVSIVSFET